MPERYTFDMQALESACRDIARVTLWQAPNPHTLDDIVTDEEIAAAVAAYEKEALFHLEYVQGRGRDPNLITRAVQYLAAAHALPPMKGDTHWFRDGLSVLVELACPNALVEGDAAAFFADIREGLDELETESE